jgi:hypothetical protein
MGLNLSTLAASPINHIMFGWSQSSRHRLSAIKSLTSRGDSANSTNGKPTTEFYLAKELNDNDMTLIALSDIKPIVRNPGVYGDLRKINKAKKLVSH